MVSGSETDFTAPQFGEHYPEGMKAEVRARSYVTSHAETARRYKLLAYRLARLCSDCNQIFDDEIYRRCFYAALDSECQKMRFGCVIVHNGEIVYRGCNKKIEALKCLCEPKCIRFGITSRTESMLGACGHAEEQGLWNVVRRGIPISECELYVAGFYPSGIPWIKERIEHTCLRCAVQMHYANIIYVLVPVHDRWEMSTPNEALKTARSYAGSHLSIYEMFSSNQQ